MKEVNTQNLWNFELGTQEGINIPKWIIVSFQQSDRQHDQDLILSNNLLSTNPSFFLKEASFGEKLLLKYVLDY